MSRYRGPSTTLYVRNISERVRFEDLKRLFDKYGRVVDVTIPTDYYSGLPKGYSFVEFEDVRDAEEAQYKMNRQRLFGREIEVEFARGIRKTPGEMRTRTRSSRSRDRGSEGRSSRGHGDRDYDRGRRDDYRRREDYGGGGGRREEYDRIPSGYNGRSRSRSRGDERRMAPNGGGGGSRSRKQREPSYTPSKSRSPSPAQMIDRGGSRNHHQGSHHRSMPQRSVSRSPRHHRPIERSRSPVERSRSRSLSENSKRARSPNKADINSRSVSPV